MRRLDLEDFVRIYWKTDEKEEIPEERWRYADEVSLYASLWKARHLSIAELQQRLLIIFEQRRFNNETDAYERLDSPQGIYIPICFDSVTLAPENGNDSLSPFAMVFC